MYILLRLPLKIALATELVCVEMNFDKLMDTLSSGRNSIPGVKILINPTFHKFLFVEFKPCLDYLAHFSSMGWNITLFKLLQSLFKCLLR